MASARFQIMARDGPEDALKAVKLGTNSSAQATAGSDWAIVRESTGPAVTETALADATRYAGIVEGTGQDSIILHDLAQSRLICSQPRFALAVCKQSYRAHQVKQCTPAYVEHLKCGIKLARAVDTLCSAQFASLSSCLSSETAKGDASKCAVQLTRFDQCTEDF